ncbi:MAG: carbohydrate kinase [Gammaproteobacteria bacterium]|nr:MAG: carbohydrate kinase [Gammaproteobacteria bacterium]
MFLSCGDALFDLFAAPRSEAGSIALHGRVGGSPLNVALGLARLGAESAFLCKNSGDVFGRRLRQCLVANRVDTRWVVDTDRNTSLAVVETGADGVPSYAFYLDGSADVSLEESELPEKLDDAVRAIHFSSYSTVRQPVAGALLALARREGTDRIISHDVNVRASVEPDLDVWREARQAFGEVAHLVKASDEDLAILAGRSSVDIEAFAADALALGASLVLVTRGDAGAHAFTADGQHVQVPAVTVGVVDTVGAGDSFQAASLYWLAGKGAMQGGQLKLDGLDLGAMLTFAVNAAAITCSREGADLPLLEDIPVDPG